MQGHRRRRSRSGQDAELGASTGKQLSFVSSWQRRRWAGQSVGLAGLNVLGGATGCPPAAWCLDLGDEGQGILPPAVEESDRGDGL